MSARDIVGQGGGLDLVKMVLLIAGLLGIIIGSAMQTVAEDANKLHRESCTVVVLGLTCLGFAILIERSV